MPTSTWFSRSFKLLILALGLTSAVYLGFIMKSFVDEAGVVVNIGKDTTDNPIKRIVNKTSFTPPLNGQLQLDQIDMMMHIVEATASIPKGASTAALQDVIIRQINEYTISLSEYRWIRSRFVQALEGRGPNRIRAGTTFGRYQSISETTLDQCRTFFRDTTDRGLL